MSSAASSLQAFPACCSQHPAVHEKFFAHEAFLRHPGIMIDGHRNTSCDKTLRSRTWLHDMTGFMAPSISWPCMTCGKQIRTNSLETPPKKHSLRDVTAHVPQLSAQVFVHGFCRRVVFKFPTLHLRDGRQRCQDSKYSLKMPAWESTCEAPRWL